MKKLTLRYRRWLVYRARKNSKARTEKIGAPSKKNSRVVTGWFGDRVERLISTREPRQPPKNICFHLNSEETLRFLHEGRESFGVNYQASRTKYDWVIRPKRLGRMGRIRGYVDFSTIEFLSTAAALVIAAEYDRVGRMIGSVPPTINLDDWQWPVFKKFFELGFFEIVGLTKDIGEHYREDGDIKTMKIITGSNAADLQRASEQLIELSKFIDDSGPMSEDVIFALNSALSEAMVNVSRHAYPTDHIFRYKHVNAWWVTASADRLNRRLTVVIYDQGASIPVTLPKKPWMKAAHDLILRSLSPHKEYTYQDDALYIEGAMRLGETQTGEPGRGEGLPQMKDLVDICGEVL